MKITVDEIGNWFIEGIEKDKYFNPSMPISALTILIQSKLDLKRPFTIEVKEVC